MKLLGCIKLVLLTTGSHKILTDYSGIKREAYLLKKPYILLIELSWFTEISKVEWKILTQSNPNLIAFLINNFEPNGEHPEIFCNGRVDLKIIEDLEERFGK